MVSSTKSFSVLILNHVVLTSTMMHALVIGETNLTTAVTHPFPKQLKTKSTKRFFSIFSFYFFHSLYFYKLSFHLYFHFSLSFCTLTNFVNQNLCFPSAWNQKTKRRTPHLVLKINMHCRYGGMTRNMRDTTSDGNNGMYTWL